MSLHLTQAELLCHLDGELSRSQMRKTTAHLGVCASCRAELDHLKDDLAAILDAQNNSFGPALPPPPAPWPRLEPRLNWQSSSKRAPSWKNLVPSGATFWSRFAYYVAMASVVVGISIWFMVRPVSAQEVLRRAIAADARRLAIRPQQVVRQRVKVKRTNRVTSAEQIARLESWKSVTSSYWAVAGDAVNAGLEARYQSNGLSSEIPLSPPAIRAWTRIAGSEPSASASGDAIDVRVASNAQGRLRGLQVVQFHIQRPNWHLDQMTLSFNDATYQITEEESSIVARSDVPNEVMENLEPQEFTSPNVAPIQPPTVPSTPAAPVNLEDLEMAVRYDLHRIGADLGEDIEISHRGLSTLLVDVGQVPKQSKQQIIDALSDRPGVQLEFRDSATPAPDRSVNRRIPGSTTSTPLDPRIATFFTSPEAKENYVRTLLDTSNTLLMHLYALGTLASRWPPDQERHLSTASKALLDSMLRDHGRESISATSAMEHELEPLMTSLGYPLNANSPPSSGVPWQEAGASGLDAARNIDRTLRSLLTTSDNPLGPEVALPRLQESFRDLEGAIQSLPTPLK